MPTRENGDFCTIFSEKQRFQPDLTALIDPHGGQQDLRNKVLRHVTDAFREDPVRILRVARFAVRFADFSVAPETMQLMREMVAQGEADHLLAERMGQELARGLMAGKPSLKHALSGSGKRTLMKLIVEDARDRVVGLHMVGPDAGEIAQGFAVAMKAGATKAIFDSTIGIHPTAAEEFVTMREPVKAGLGLPTTVVKTA